MPNKPPIASVYAIVNKINGKMYIGFTTKPLKTRLYQHRSKVGTPQAARIHRAMDKYGVEHFEIQLLAEYTTEEDALRGEQHWIAFYNTFGTEHGYNDTPGGDRGPRLIGSENPMFGKTHDKETRQAMSAKVKSAWADPQIREKYLEKRMGTDNHFYGKKHSNETKEKMRAKAIARHRNDAGQFANRKVG